MPPHHHHHHHHHHHKHKDKYWEELPGKAKDAATCMGYTEATWDKDEKIDYDRTPLAELSEKKKAAALYLGIEPLKSKEFSDDVSWGDLEPTCKQNAEAIGYDQHKWDHDWMIHDLPIEHKYWKDLTEEERSGAQFFGYTPATWDEVEDDLDVPFYDGDNVHDPDTPPKQQEEKKEDEHEEECASDEDEDWSEAEEEEEAEAEAEAEEDIKVPAAAAAAAAAAEPGKGKGKRKPIKNSRLFGGSDLGAKFRTGNVRHMDKLVIYADNHVVKGIEFSQGNRISVGTKSGKAHEFQLGKAEFITRAEVRASQNSIQCLTFHTNKGRKFGPCGGKGYMIGKDRAGEEYKIPAPFKYQLAGFQGSADDSHINSLAFSWGPAPPPPKRKA